MVKGWKNNETLNGHIKSVNYLTTRWKLRNFDYILPDDGADLNVDDNSDMDGDWEKSKEDETLLQNDHNKDFEVTRNSIGYIQKALDIIKEYLPSKMKCKTSKIRDTEMSRNTRDRQRYRK